MRLFASAGPIGRILENSFAEGEALTHPLLNRSIQTAQKRVEEQNYAMRKRLLKYDDVLNRQREVIYSMRNGAIRNTEPQGLIFELITDYLENKIHPLANENLDKPLEIKALEEFIVWMNHQFPIHANVDNFTKTPAKDLTDKLMALIRQAYQEAAQNHPAAMMDSVTRQVLIRPIDRNWQDHLTEMEELRRSVNLRSYGQKDPLNEYKKEAFKCFELLMKRVYEEIATGLFRILQRLDALKKMEMEAMRLQEQAKALASKTNSENASLEGPSNNPKALAGGPSDALIKFLAAAKETQKKWAAPCDCGSGKPFGQCCGPKQMAQKNNEAK
jgi:preprotein translocase subunit SecA